MAKDKNILTSPDSKLVDVDLVKLLADPATWAYFDDNDKAQIRDLVPDHVPVDGEGLPTKEWLRYNPDWQQAVRLHQADLRAGRMDPQWQAEAAQAMEERADGEFDDWKEKNFEEHWGQKSKPPVRSRVKVVKVEGEKGTSVKVEGSKGSASLRFPQMVRDGVFQVGDIWCYSRLYPSGGGTSNVLVEKGVKVMAINADKGVITFAIPPGISNVAPNVTAPEAAALQTTQDNCIVHETASHIELAKKILHVDGRINPNSLGRIRTAWEDIQCYRGATAMGSLFDLREAHYLSLNPEG